MLKPLIFLAFFLISIDSYSQDESINFGVGYEKMLGINHWTFKPSFSYSLEYHVSELYFGVGYMNFHPIRDTFYVADNSPIGYYTIAYMNYWVIPIYMGFEYRIELNDKWSITPGIHIGYYLCRLHYDLNSSTRDFSSTSIGRKGFSLKTSIEYQFADRFRFFFTPKYNGTHEVSSGDNHEQSLGNYHHFLSYGIGLSYIIQ
jgi:hypothetical protein